MWFTLQSDIQKHGQPVIERMEFDMKDELILQTIMDTQEDVDEIKEKLDKIDEHFMRYKKITNEKKYNFIYISFVKLCWI